MAPDYTLLGLLRECAPVYATLVVFLRCACHEFGRLAVCT